MKHRRKNAEPIERLRRALSEAVAALRELEGKATTESQPPTAPGNPPPKGGEG